MPTLLVVADNLKLLSGVSYSVATVALLRQHQRRVKESYSTMERVSLSWLFWFGSAAALIWLAAATFQLVEAAGLARIGLGDDVISVAVAIVVYGIGYRGLRQPEIFRYETAEFAVPVELIASHAPAPQPVEALASGPAASGPQLVRDDPADEIAPRYERSGLSERQAIRLQDALLALMDEKEPWRDSELTLADLATTLGTTPHKLSEVLNTLLGTNFYDFVNGYRVREVQRRIAAGDAERVKMLSIALDAGFASKSTFNLVFKKHTQQTPSDYRQAAGA